MALASATIAALLAGCGGGDDGVSGSSTPVTPYDPYIPEVAIQTCVPGSDVVGTWKVVANNQTLMPNSPQLAFFSYNQPSVNESGLVVFRGRAKDATGSSGEIQRGIYATEACLTQRLIYTVADTVDTLVPAPNNANAALALYCQTSPTFST